MSLGPVMLDLAGKEISAEERERLRHPLVGGVILFTRNYESPEQITHLVEQIHHAKGSRLLVGVDHEGGRVQRFRQGFTHIPPARMVGKVFDHNHKKGRQLAETFGWLMASELRAVGVDFSFAPVLDLDREVSTVIGDRSFHRVPEHLSELAHAFMVGMNHAGMAATGKHFPGHGGVEADSHIAIPVDERDYNDLYAQDIQPFKRMIKHGLAAIMPAHVIYPKVDPQPAGFSRFWLQEVLRKRLGFQGVIFSDDLSMEGATVAGGFVERGEAALAAGCDMILVCNNPDAASQVLDGLKVKSDPVSQVRLARMHGRHPISREQLMQDEHWHQAVAAVSQFDLHPTLKMDV